MFSLLRRYRELILVSVLLLVPLGVFFAHAHKPSERSKLDRAVLWLTTPIERAIDWTVTGTLSAFREYVALRHAHERAMALSQEVNFLRMEKQQLLADREEVGRLRRLLAFREVSPKRTYLGARVIGIKLGPTGLQLLTVDRGASDGIAKMMPVVVADGVVGRVYSTNSNTSDVLVLTDRNSSVGVRVERTRARADVRGLGKPNACRLDFALRSEDMIEGDLLVTSGTDGVFPRGLPVGRVSKIERRPHGLFFEAEVRPSVDVTRVEEVLVITEFEPPAPEAEPTAVSPEDAMKGSTALNASSPGASPKAGSEPKSPPAATVPVSASVPPAQPGGGTSSSASAYPEAPTVAAPSDASQAAPTPGAVPP